VRAMVAYPPSNDLTVEAIPVFVGYQHLHLAGLSCPVQTTALGEYITHTDYPSASAIFTIFA
jgi:hypothetical protein